MNRITRITLSTILLMSGLTLSAQTQFRLTQSSYCSTAVAAVNCSIPIPPKTTGGFYPLLLIEFNPATGGGSMGFETFQQVENADGPYLNNGVIDLAAPVWQTVMSNGQTSYQITRLTLYGWGSYAPASGIAACPGPDAHGQLDPSRCWVVKPTTLYFTYRAILHQGGTWTWDRSFYVGELTFSQIQ
jgi:hypothetical protein